MINGAIYITPAALLLGRKITPLPKGILLFPLLPAHCPPLSLRRLWVDEDDPTPLRCTVKSTWGDEGRVLEPVSMVDFTDFVSIWNLITKPVLGRQPGQARPAGFRKAERLIEREREREFPVYHQALINIQIHSFITALALFILHLRLF
jgi:hypothetical protein